MSDSGGMGGGNMNSVGVDAEHLDTEGESRSNSPSEQLQSMGYVDGEGEVSNEDSTSYIQEIVIFLMASVFGLLFLYYTVAGILSFFGIHL